MTDLYNVDIPDLLSNVPLNLPIQPGSGDDYYVTMEDVRNLDYRVRRLEMLLKK